LIRVAFRVCVCIEGDALCVVWGVREERQDSDGRRGRAYGRRVAIVADGDNRHQENE
jgi:hypothetical protein